jgi:hypothetical protein
MNHSPIEELEALGYDVRVIESHVFVVNRDGDEVLTLPPGPAAARSGSQRRRAPIHGTSRDARRTGSGGHLTVGVEEALHQQGIHAEPGGLDLGPAVDQAPEQA